MTQNRRALGASDIMISPLGLGCWQFSQGAGWVGRFWPVLAEEDIQQIVDKSIAGGINWFDTAEIYGGGNSEKALARALRNNREIPFDLTIATKWWPFMRTARSLMTTMKDRQEALAGFRIDLHQIHQPFSLSSVKKQIDALADLIQNQQIRYAGISNFSAAKMRAAHQHLSRHGYPLLSNQVKYNLLDRRIERNGILQAAKELGMTIIAYSPLEQGLLTGKYHKNPKLLQSLKGPRKLLPKFKPSGLQKTQPVIDLLDQFAEKYAATPSQIALNWLIHVHGDRVVAIPGASKPHHAEQNTGALDFQLSRTDIDALDKVSRHL